MVQVDELNRHGVWMEEALHRTANLRQVGISLERLVERGRINTRDRTRTIRGAKTLARAYQTLDMADEVTPVSCARGLRDIAAGLVEIFGHTVDSLELSLEIQLCHWPEKGDARCCSRYRNSWSTHYATRSSVDGQVSYRSGSITTRLARRQRCSWRMMASAGRPHARRRPGLQDHPWPRRCTGR